MSHDFTMKLIRNFHITFVLLSVANALNQEENNSAWESREIFIIIHRRHCKIHRSMAFFHSRTLALCRHHQFNKCLLISFCASDGSVGRNVIYKTTIIFIIMCSFFLDIKQYPFSLSLSVTVFDFNAISTRYKKKVFLNFFRRF